MLSSSRELCTLSMIAELGCDSLAHFTHVLQGYQTHTETTMHLLQCSMKTYQITTDPLILCFPHPAEAFMVLSVWFMGILRLANEHAWLGGMHIRPYNLRPAVISIIFMSTHSMGPHTSNMSYMPWNSRNGLMEQVNPVHNKWTHL